EQVELDASGAAAEVVRADFHGHDALLTLRLASGAGALVQCRLAHPVALPRVGDAVRVSVKGAALLVSPGAAHSVSR
ncbi:MAG: TOBE domain-containing protein, partial [Micropruina sp.]